MLLIIISHTTDNIAQEVDKIVKEHGIGKKAMKKVFNQIEDEDKKRLLLSSI